MLNQSTLPKGKVSPALMLMVSGGDGDCATA
jgi:hypothetical protein